MMPAVLNNAVNIFLGCNFRDQINNIMLSRLTIIFYISTGVFLVLEYFIKFCEKVVTDANLILSRLAGERSIATISLSVFVLIISYVVVNIVFVHIKATFLKLRSGQPPYGSLIVAYKFLSHDLNKFENVFSETKKLFPDKKLIQFYYSGSQAIEKMGVAYGVILSDSCGHLEDDLLYVLFQNGFKLFRTPAINNAVHITCPVISWLSVPTYYIALRQLYPRLLRFCEKRALCAYPVIEIFHKDEITLLAPLSRQDAFVVDEAEDLFRNAVENIVDSRTSSFGSCSSIKTNTKA